MLPPDALELLDAACDAATDLGVELWAVGGAIRDLAAGIEPAELDLACGESSATLAAATAARLRNGGGEAPTVHREPRFATARIELRGRRIDLAELRSERYPRPGALPEVRSGATIEEDLGRRDFSVNAVALGVAGPRRGELLDPFGGLEDLAARRLRALHAGSFRDDATRLWRGARYAAALGLRPEPETARWIEDAPRWGRAHLRPPPLGGVRAHCRRPPRRRDAPPARRLGRAARRASGVVAPARGVARARPAAGAASALATARRPDCAAGRARRDRRPAHGPAIRPPCGGRDGAPDRARERTPDTLAALEGVSGEARLAARWLDPAGQRLLQRDLRRWERTRPPLDARALLRLGVEPGPALGEWLERLRRERYLGTLRDAASARRAVRAGPRSTVETEER